VDSFHGVLGVLTCARHNQNGQTEVTLTLFSRTTGSRASITMARRGSITTGTDTTIPKSADTSVPTPSAYAAD
jgi:hypothetical protein